MAASKLNDQIAKALGTVLKSHLSGGSDEVKKVNAMISSASSKEMKSELAEVVEKYQKIENEKLLQDFADAIVSFCNKNDVPLSVAPVKSKATKTTAKKKAGKAPAKKTSAIKNTGKRVRMDRPAMVKELEALAKKRGSKGFTRAEIMDLWGIKAQNATNLLRFAIDKGVLKKTGSQRSTRYFLK